MTYQNLLVTQRGRVTTITINRPQVMNALDGVTQEELQSAIDAFAADANARVCILTGAGERAFCAGSDLKSSAKFDGDGPKPAPVYPKCGYAGLAERFDLLKPLIAAVNGVALGGGFEIALACDIVVASETARFGLPEPKVGGVALGGGVHRLMRQIGPKRAMELIITARLMGAEEAERFGVVNYVVPASELMDRANAIADTILACSPAAIAASKQCAYDGLDEPSLAKAIAGQAGYAAFQAYLASPDRTEGPRAFAEKRKPEWSNL